MYLNMQKLTFALSQPAKKYLDKTFSHERCFQVTTVIQIQGIFSQPIQTQGFGFCYV